MNETMVQEEFGARCQQILKAAQEVFRRSPDWVTFFREVLGVGGVARSAFPNQRDYVAFEKTEAFSQIQQLVAALRNRKASANANGEPTRVITVRLPESLHEALKAEAEDHNTSMNRLCISKLLQVLMDDESAAQTAMPTPVVTPRMAPAPAVPMGSVDASRI